MCWPLPGHPGCYMLLPRVEMAVVQGICLLRDCELIRSMGTPPERREISDIHSFGEAQENVFML